MGHDLGKLTEQFEEKINEARLAVGTINIAVFGNTGVGKSTLVNAVFGRDLAATGTGAAVTAHVAYHGGPPEPLGIYDTPGFEIGDAADELLAEITKIVTEPRTEPIHLVWFVENAHSRRFTDGQARLVSKFSQLGLPTMMILSQTPLTRDGAHSPSALEFAAKIEARGLPLKPDGKVLLINAVANEDYGTPPHGLHELLDATFRAVPAELHDPLAAAQQLDMKPKRERARRIVRASIAAAGLSGASAGLPVPLLDTGLVISTLVAMLAKISAAYGIPARKGQLAKIAAMALTGGGAVAATRKVASGAAARWAEKQAAKQAAKQLAKEGAKQVAKEGAKFGGKLVPIVNLIIGAATAASAMVSATAAGYAWMRTCEHMLTRAGTEDDALEVFLHNFHHRTGPPE